jgi:RHS repeat-associated protein
MQSQNFILLSENYFSKNFNISLYSFNGQEKDDEVYGSTGTIQDYGFRMYDSRICRFISVDPIACKYPELTPYQFASNTPLWGIDLDGLEVKVYTETIGFGHTFLSVGKGKDIVVYTYGRYLGGEGFFGLYGRGVLVKLTGKDAKKYIKDEVKGVKAKSYEIKDAKEDEVKAVADKVFGMGRKLTTDEATKEYKMANEGYGTAEDARVVDSYDAFNNNCTTKVIDALKVGGSSLSYKLPVFLNVPGGSIQLEKIYSPSQLQDYLTEQASNNKSKVEDVTKSASNEVDTVK